jgi:hypothetical protein
VARPEDDLLADVIAEAQRFGWLHYHPYRSDRSVPGFPDLVLVKHRIMYRELKIPSIPSVVTMPQRVWLHRLRGAGADADVWTLEDWPLHIISELRATEPRREPRPLPELPDNPRHLVAAQLNAHSRQRRPRPRR